MYLTGLDMFYPAHKIVGNEELSSSSSISCVCLKSMTFQLLWTYADIIATSSSSKLIRLD